MKMMPSYCTQFNDYECTEEYCCLNENKAIENNQVEINEKDK